MSHPLEQRLALLRGRVRRLVVVYGISTVVAASLAVALVLGLADYLIHFQDRGIRVIMWLAVLGVLGHTAWRSLLRPLAARLGDAELAGRLQNRFASLDDRLLSAVEFLRQPEDDPAAGSPILRQAVIAEAAAETEQLDFGAVINRRPSLRACALAGIVVLAVTVVTIMDPAGSRIAAVRLLDPFSDLAWPQVTHLVLRPPAPLGGYPVARGQAFEVEVLDAQGARLPAEVRIHYRFPDDERKTGEVVERMQWRGGAMVARRENVMRLFDFRIEGGDDQSMPWTPVEVIEPAAVRSLAIELFPPEYTGWPPEKIEAGGSIRALVGTRVRMRGESTKPLRSAALCLEGGRQIPATLEPDGLHFDIGRNLPSPALGEAPTTTMLRTVPDPGVRALPELVVEKSGAYWFMLTDRDGLTGGGEARSEIVAVADRPPTVTIEQPAADLFVTPGAVVPLHVTARDDLALREVTLVAAPLPGPTPEGWHVALYTGPDHAVPRPPGGRTADAEAGDLRVIDYRWELAELKLSPGTQVVFFVRAEDYKPQAGKSDPRRLSVITAEELQERIAARQNLLLAELARVLKLQRDVRGQTEALEIRVRHAGGLEPLQVDHLQAAELGQRQVGRNLASRQDGVAMHLVALLADLENNRLDHPDFERRARAFLGEIERLGREPLPRIGRELGSAIKSAQIRLQEKSRPAAPDAATAASLGRALAGQDEVLASLEAMLGQLRQWDDYRRFHRDVAQLLRDQGDVARGTAEIGRLTLTRDLADFTPQETADLTVLAGRQLDLARRLDRILQEMEQAAAQLRQADPLAADMIADAWDEARRLALAAAMRSAAALVQENRIGRAAETHKQVLAGLQEVLDILANRRQQELSRLVGKLREAEGELRAIHEQQERLRNEIAGSGSPAEKGPSGEALRALGRRQEEVRDATERLARRLERLLAEQAGRAVLRAAGEMNEAARAAAPPKGYPDRAAAARAAEAAEKTLAAALGLLAGRRLQAQAELAMEQLARLQDTVKHLRGRQQNLLDQTRGIEATRQRGALGRAEAAGIRDLARLEQSLQAQTAGLAADMVAAEGFQAVLSGVQGEMGRAAAVLDGGQTGPAAQQPQQDALARLDLILQALEPEKAGAGPAGGGDGAGQSGTGAPSGSTGVQTLAEIKLLKLLQEDINIRTEKLQAAVAAAGQLGQEHRKLLAQLGEEQGRLADLVLRMARPEKTGGEQESGVPPQDPRKRTEDRRPQTPKEVTP